MIENLPGFSFSDRFGRPTAANLKSWHAPVIMARMTLLRMGLLLVWLAMPDPCLPAGQTKSPSPYFAIHVVDAETGRGVPMVELQTTSSVRYYTDSNGLVAFAEPGLMNQRVWFGVSAHGYQFQPDGFGIRGAALETKPGGSAQLKIKRLNIAERLYRITGQGIYRDTVLLGRKPPIAEPLLNAAVTGQDGILTAIYCGKLYWFYGDTNRLSYALGNFSMSGATTDLPDKIDPSFGFNLKYFTARDGFAKAMAPMAGEGVVWLSGLVVIPDECGRMRLLAYFQRRRGLGAVLENGFVVYNDAKEVFEKLQNVTLDPPIFPQGYSFRVKTDDGTDYVYFTAPYPALRVKALEKSYLDLASYEGYTCLKPGTRYGGKGQADLDRDARGKLVWAWKKDTPPLGSKQQQELIAAGKMKREESPFRLQDAGSGKPILLNNCSCFWNDYRKRYIMIASESFGATMLGEVWYSEADHPEGPWLYARKIITHANKKDDAHDFYNPTQHPFFDRAGGRLIYLEGSYVNTFSGNPHPTPYYEYNQIMYRLDLSDSRLKLPAEPAAKPQSLSK
ncbi:MAG TPA: hypothetical protein VGY66_36215 [Gemmataceae bacterium]|nr:hypothetical protein [Gemmataceae bacterium]